MRELENLIERAVALESSAMLGAAHFPDRRPALVSVGQGPREFPESGLDLDVALAELERSLILAALARAGGVRKRAATLLNVSFRSLRYRLQKLGIELGRSDAD